VVGDPKMTLRTLLSKLTGNRDDSHLAAALEQFRTARKKLDELSLEKAGTIRRKLKVAS
jgi:hypothetical protein